MATATKRRVLFEKVSKNEWVCKICGPEGETFARGDKAAHAQRHIDARKEEARRKSETAAQQQPSAEVAETISASPVIVARRRRVKPPGPLRVEGDVGSLQSSVAVLDEEETRARDPETCFHCGEPVEDPLHQGSTCPNPNCRAQKWYSARVN